MTLPSLFECFQNFHEECLNGFMTYDLGSMVTIGYLLHD